MKLYPYAKTIERPDLPEQDAPDGSSWACPDCPVKSTLADNAKAHRWSTGHGLPTLVDDERENLRRENLRRENDARLAAAVEVVVTLLQNEGKSRLAEEVQEALVDYTMKTEVMTTPRSISDDIESVVREARLDERRRIVRYLRENWRWLAAQRKTSVYSVNKPPEDRHTLADAIERGDYER